MEVAQGILGSAAGFGYYKIVFGKRQLQTKLPRIKFKKIEFCPHFKVHLKNRTIHIHHWVTFSLIFAYLQHIAPNISQFLFVKSLLAGSIAEGFTSKTRFTFFIKD